MKILILSDIHKRHDILENILKDNKDVDMKIFLGDFEMSPTQQDELTSMFDYCVVGNCDFKGFANEREIITIDGINIFITHGHIYQSMLQKIDFYAMVESAKRHNASLILHGHDHIAAKVEYDNGKIIRFNPGSPTLPKGGTKASYGLLEIEDGKIISLDHIYVS